MTAPGPIRGSSLRYRARRVAVWPRTRIQRWRHRDASPVARAMLETMGYRRSMLQFMGATAQNPQILTTFDIDGTSTVIDAGAFQGTWATEIADRYGSSVHAFEPEPGLPGWPGR